MNRFHLTSTTVIGVLFLAAAAFAADLSQPAPESRWDAYVSAGGGYTSFDNSFSMDDDGFAGVPILSNDTEGFAGEVLSSAAYQFTNGFGIQGDVTFNYQGLDIRDYGITSTDVVGHVFYRDQNFLVGAFGQFGFTDYESRPYDIDRVYGGGEAQFFWGGFTLYGQAGVQRQAWGVRAPGIDIDGFFVSAEGRYFATDNLKLNLKAGYETLDLDGIADIDTVHVGTGVEYRFYDSPFSTFLNVDFNQRESDIVDMKEVRVLAGIKVNLGTDTLIQRDRNGASLDSIEFLAIGPLLP